MATVKICDICNTRTYPIETFSWDSGETQTGIDSAEDIYDTHDICVVCLSNFFLLFHKNNRNMITEVFLNNELKKYKKEK